MYQDPSTLLIEPRPERIESYNNTYPNPERVMDMPGTDIPGFAGVPEVDGAIPPGILVNILRILCICFLTFFVRICFSFL